MMECISLYLTQCNTTLRANKRREKMVRSAEQSAVMACAVTESIKTSLHLLRGPVDSSLLLLLLCIDRSIHTSYACDKYMHDSILKETGTVWFYVLFP